MPFCAGLLQNVDLSNRDCQALILAPTRELASQIVKVVVALGDYLGVTTMVRVVGPMMMHMLSINASPQLSCVLVSRLALVALTCARTWKDCGAACSW